MTPPRILGISDLHGSLPEIPDCAALLIAGDVCPDYNIRGALNGAHQQATWLDNEFTDWVLALQARNIQVVYIAGNHDFVFEHSALLDPRTLPGYYLRDEPLTLYFDREGKYTLKLWGSPWVPNLPFWAFYSNDAQLEARGSIIPEGLDVLIAHGPPYGYLDKVAGAGPVGEKGMRKILDRTNPVVYLCGHIHEGRGIAYRDNTVIVNASHVDEFYDFDNARGPIDLTGYIYG